MFIRARWGVIAVTIAIVVGLPSMALAAGTISGTVSDDNGNTLSGITVGLFTRTFSGSTATCTPVGSPVVTDTSGFYTLSPSVDRPDYIVEFNVNGADTAYTSQWFNGEASCADADSIDSSGGVSGVSGQLDGVPGSVSGAVTDASTGAAIAGVEVELLNAAGQDQANATTQANGAYEVTNLPAGTYFAKFAPAAGVPYTPQFYFNKPTLASANAVTIDGGANTPNIDAALVHTSTTTSPTAPTNPTTPTTPTKPQGAPTLSNGRLAGLGKRKASLRFEVIAGANGAPGLKTVTINLPTGVTLVKRGLKRGLKVSGAGNHTIKLGKHGFTLTLNTAAAKVSIALGAKALSVSNTLARRARARTDKRVTVTITITDAASKRTTDRITFSRPH